MFGIILISLLLALTIISFYQSLRDKKQKRIFLDILIVLFVLGLLLDRLGYIELL